jgi:hypothetical protein
MEKHIKQYRITNPAHRSAWHLWAARQAGEQVAVDEDISDGPAELVGADGDWKAFAVVEGGDIGELFPRPPVGPGFIERAVRQRVERREVRELLRGDVFMLDGRPVLVERVQDTEDPESFIVVEYTPWRDGDYSASLRANQRVDVLV